MLVRAWNLFHGNTSPPGRRAHLREMIELVTADRPGIVCLQEVPPWAFDRIGEWAGMQAIVAQTRRPKLGPLPLTAGLGGKLTSLNAGRFRSTFSGQGNAILITKEATIRVEKQITLNTNPFCERQAKRLGLTPKQARQWEKERRICQVLKLELPNGRKLLVANLHATSHPADPRLADAELHKAARYVDRAVELDEIVVIAGDFNVTLEQSQTLHVLTRREHEPYSAAGPEIDHVLVRGGRTSDFRVWDEDERRYDGKLLSDHAPVELNLLAKVEPKKPKPPPLPKPVAGPGWEVER